MENLTVKTFEDMLGRNLSQQEAATVNWLAGWESETKSIILNMMLEYGEKRSAETNKKQLVDSKEAIELLYQFTPPQKILVLGYLVGKMYSNEEFVDALREATENIKTSEQ